MKKVWNTLMLVLTTILDVVAKLAQGTGRIANAYDSLTAVAEDAAEAFRKEEAISNANKLAELKSTYANSSAKTEDLNKFFDGLTFVDSVEPSDKTKKSGKTKKSEKSVE